MINQDRPLTSVPSSLPHNGRAHGGRVRNGGSPMAQYEALNERIRELQREVAIYQVALIVFVVMALAALKWGA